MHGQLLIEPGDFDWTLGSLKNGKRRHQYKVNSDCIECMKWCWIGFEWSGKWNKETHIG